MRKISVIIAVILILGIMVSEISVNAGVPVNSAVLKYTPEIDGKLDAAYTQSFYINHEWPLEKTSEKYWGGGRFEFDNQKNPHTGAVLPGSVGYNTAYGWDLQATTYFLWDDDYLYIAVRVIDDDYGCIDDEHYSMAAVDASNWGPWLQDSVCVGLSYKGMFFDIRADRAGRYASVFRESNYGHQVWCDMYSWFEHTGNKKAGYYATSETGSGYLIELKIPVSTGVKETLLRDGGNFKFGITIVDAGENSPYLPDEGQKANGVEIEGYQLADFMVHTDCLNTADIKPNQKIVLSDKAPVVDVTDEPSDSIGNQTVEPTTEKATDENDKETQIKNETSSLDLPSAPTGDAAVITLSASLVSGIVFVIINGKKDYK